MQSGSKVGAGPRKLRSGCEGNRASLKDFLKRICRIRLIRRPVMWKGIQGTQILVGTLLCTCCVTPGELVDWPLWALVPSLKKGRNAPTLPTLHGLVGITWQSTWERLWKRFGPAHRKVPSKGSGSRQKTRLLSRTGVYSPHTLHCAWHPVSTEYTFVE